MDDRSPPQRPALATRRRFLLGAGVAGVAGAAASAAAVGQAVLPAALPAAPPDALARGYRESDHVRQYYRTTEI
jgi:hypothetical protein